MNTEQLQMILNALQGLGVEGKSAFIWWLILDKGLPVLAWLLAFCGLVVIVFRVINTWSANSHLAKLRDEMRIGSPGPLDFWEAEEVVKKVRSLMRNERTSN